jgi:hypothetical protein
VKIHEHGLHIGNRPVIKQFYIVSDNCSEDWENFYIASFKKKEEAERFIKMVAMIDIAIEDLESLIMLSDATMQNNLDRIRRDLQSAQWKY